MRPAHPASSAPQRAAASCTGAHAAAAAAVADWAEAKAWEEEQPLALGVHALWVGEWEGMEDRL